MKIIFIISFKYWIKDSLNGIFFFFSRYSHGVTHPYLPSHHPHSHLTTQHHALARGIPGISSPTSHPALQHYPPPPGPLPSAQSTSTPWLPDNYRDQFHMDPLQRLHFNSYMTSATYGADNKLYPGYPSAAHTSSTMRPKDLTPGQLNNYLTPHGAVIGSGQFIGATPTSQLLEKTLLHNPDLSKSDNLPTTR